MNANSSASDKKWLAINLFCPLPLLEALGDLLAVLSNSGIGQSPESPEGAMLSAFFPLDDEQQQDEILAHVRAEVDQLFALYKLPPPPMESNLLADEDWATSWQRYFKAFEIVPGLIICPSWESFQPAEDQQVLEMDPGMAFGTGQHATTRMALKLIRHCLTEKQAERVLDVGTGTGILAMAALLFGADSALGLDNDPEALKVAERNLRANGLESRIELSSSAVEDIQQADFPLICANIVHDVLVVMAPHLVRLLAPRGNLILSGILSGAQEQNILRQYHELGLELTKSLHEDEWCALLLSKASR